MAARIVALVNRYDNLCNPHLLARALTPHESLSLLFAQGRSKFDTSILGAFIKMMGVYPPGSTVQLTDDRYALGRRRQLVAAAEAERARPRPGDAARRGAGARPREAPAGLGIRRSIQRAAAAADGARLPGAERARRLLLRAFAGAEESTERRMNNPLPVDPFSVAEAARRTWPALIESMLEAVCLVEPEGLRIVAANGAAGRLLGVAAGRAGRPRHARDRGDARGRVVLAARSATRAAAAQHRLRLVRHPRRRRGGAGGAPGQPDRAGAGQRALRRRPARPQRADARSSDAVAVGTAELAATLESVADGVLVVDLAGHISHFNRRFAALWELPDEMLLLRADDEIFDWMRQQRRRPGGVHAPAGRDRRRRRCCEATDTLPLRSGAVLERMTAAAAAAAGGRSAACSPSGSSPPTRPERDPGAGAGLPAAIAIGRPR